MSKSKKLTKKEKQLINNVINIKITDEKKKEKRKAKRKLRKEKELKQSKPAFSNFQYPQPIIINPQQQKQLNLDFDKKVASALQTKFDEEYTKRENEKATRKASTTTTTQPATTSESVQNNVARPSGQADTAYPGAFNAVDDGFGFSQTTDLLNKANTNYQTSQLLDTTNNLFTRPFQSTITANAIDDFSVAEPIVAKAKKAKEYDCPYCNKSYISQTNLDKHINKDHPNIASLTDNQSMPIPSSDIKTPPPRPSFVNTVVKKIDDNSLEFADDIISPTTPVITRRVKPVSRPVFDSVGFMSPKLLPPEETTEISDIDKMLSEVNSMQPLPETKPVVPDIQQEPPASSEPPTTSKPKRGRPKKTEG
jgi:hypothetical protein